MRLRSQISPSDRQPTAKKVALSSRSPASYSTFPSGTRSSLSGTRRFAASPQNTTPSPSASTSANQVAPSSIIKSGKNRKPFTLSTWTWGKPKRATPHSKGPRLTSRAFANLLGNEGIRSLSGTTSSMWPEGSNDQAHKMPVSEEVEAIGARLRTASAAEFDAVEKVISSRQPFVEGGLIPRGTDGKLDRDWLDEYDNARLQYRDLIVDTILNAANAERHEANPASLGLILRENKPFEFDNTTIQPQATYTVWDRDLETPAMILHLPFKFTLCMDFAHDGEHDPIGLQVELALQMQLNTKLSFQGFSFNGDIARVVLRRVTHCQTFCYHKAFVAHMVRLLRNHTDFRETYRFSRKTSHWNPRRGILGDFDKD